MLDSIAAIPWTWIGDGTVAQAGLRSSLSFIPQGSVKRLDKTRLECRVSQCGSCHAGDERLEGGKAHPSYAASAPCEEPLQHLRKLLESCL